jgi:hypothetical protein
MEITGVSTRRRGGAPVGTGVADGGGGLGGIAGVAAGATGGETAGSGPGVGVAAEADAGVSGAAGAGAGVVCPSREQTPAVPVIASARRRLRPCLMISVEV